MNAGFVKLGETWVNLDRVTHIERITADAEREMYRVHFAGGGHANLSLADAQTLIRFCQHNTAKLDPKVMMSQAGQS